MKKLESGNEKVESANEKNKKVPKKNFFNGGYKRVIKDKRELGCCM